MYVVTEVFNKLQKVEYGRHSIRIALLSFFGSQEMYNLSSARMLCNNRNPTIEVCSQPSALDVCATAGVIPFAQQPRVSMYGNVYTMNMFLMNGFLKIRELGAGVLGLIMLSMMSLWEAVPNNPRTDGRGPIDEPGCTPGEFRKEFFTDQLPCEVTIKAKGEYNVYCCPVYCVQPVEAREIIGFIIIEVYYEQNPLACSGLKVLPRIHIRYEGLLAKRGGTPMRATLYEYARGMVANFAPVQCIEYNVVRAAAALSMSTNLYPYVYFAAPFGGIKDGTKQLNLWDQQGFDTSFVNRTNPLVDFATTSIDDTSDVWTVDMYQPVIADVPLGRKKFQPNDSRYVDVVPLFHPRFQKESRSRFPPKIVG